MRQLIALTRDVSPSIANCELTHLSREPIDIDTARAQHAAYERALERLGCVVTRLPADASMPDSVFIEDIAIVFDEIAVVTRPGAASRQPEIAAVAKKLAQLRPLVQIVAPGTLDGGDVLVAGRMVFVGRSLRTNDAGIGQLRAAVASYGYTVVPATVHGCLHLKSAITALDDRTLLANRQWIAEDEFNQFEVLDVDNSEAMGANIVRVGRDLVYASAFPRTLEKLERRGYSISTVDVREIAKAEGAVTCCSLIFTTRSG